MTLFGFKTFRQKFFASYVALLIIFLCLIFPFVAKSVQHIVFSSMNMRADALIEKLKSAKDDLELIAMIKKEKHFVFYRIGLFDDKMRQLYDTHTRRLRGPFFYPLEFSTHTEMQQAEKTGAGYSEEYSQILEQKMIYLARRFDFHNKAYYLRLAFPYRYIQDLRHQFEIGFVLFSSIVLVLFSAMSALVVHRMTKPIHEIIKAIKPYQREKSESLPNIQLKRPIHDEFQHLANTINSLSDRIRAQMEALKEFIANASHELKTPITIIRGYAETLIDYSELPKETTSSITHKIVSNCDRMSNTVRNLLALANIDHLPASRLKPCNLIEIASACTRHIMELFPETEVSLVYDQNQSFEIIADSELLEVALTNLLDNAAKYSKQEPFIEVKLLSELDHICIQVKDNGIGIAPDDIHHIFQRFYRSKQPQANQKKGSGLGLSIVETIVEKHGGTVSVESCHGLGSTFTVKISKKVVCRDDLCYDFS